MFSINIEMWLYKANLIFFFSFPLYKVAICTCPAPCISIFWMCCNVVHVDQSPDNAAEIIACVTDVNSEIAIG